MQWLSKIDDIPEGIWNTQFPFIRREFINALQKGQCLDGESGWESNFSYDESLGIAAPSFLKQHSYGEYVFDWGWADAYHKHGIQYYPKLLIAAPYTPATGPRLLSSTPLNAHKVSQFSAQLRTSCLENNFSSTHILFPTSNELHLLQQDPQWAIREGVQFHWYNRHYTDFDDFLSRLKSRKRKAIIKERKQFQVPGFSIDRLSGADISNEDWAFFYQCYHSTYNKRGMSGYLNLTTFKALAMSMGQQMLMVIARHHGQPLACALFFYDDTTLYGRYWGCEQEINGLHFELCYYQGIEFCIQRNIGHFDPGTQGEHKISRGFEPVSTYSAHWMAHPDFHRAVSNFIRTERCQIKQYKSDCRKQLPFNEENNPQAY